MALRTRRSGWWRHAFWIVAVGIFGCNAVLGLDTRTEIDAGDDGADMTVSSDGSSGGLGPDGSSSGQGPGRDGAAGASGSGSGASGSGSGSGSSSGAASTCSTNCAATGLVCERIDGPGCEDPDWPEWPISNPPSSGSSDAGNIESYIDNLDQTVTDRVTGLMWQQNAPTATYSQSDGITYCKNLRLAEYTDWRLPSQPELVSLVDFGATNPSINTKFFPNASSYAFWSSTVETGNGAFAWGITFIYGNGGLNAVITGNDVRCVR